MSDEVIYAWREDQGDVWTGEWALDRKDKWVPAEAVEYIRADLCVTRADLDAAVALALEGAAKAVQAMVLFNPHGYRTITTRNHALSEAFDAIRALIQPHQADALARVRQEAHNVAIEAAATRFPDGRQPWPPHAIRKAIRALALPVDGGPQGRARHPVAGAGEGWSVE